MLGNSQDSPGPYPMAVPDDHPQDRALGQATNKPVPEQGADHQPAPPPPASPALNDFQITFADEMLEALTPGLVATAVLTGIVGISLLVGGRRDLQQT